MTCEKHRKANLKAECVYCGERMIMIKGSWYGMNYLIDLINKDVNKKRFILAEKGRRGKR